MPLDITYATFAEVSSRGWFAWWVNQDKLSLGWEGEWGLPQDFFFWSVDTE